MIQKSSKASTNKKIFRKTNTPLRQVHDFVRRKNGGNKGGEKVQVENFVSLHCIAELKTGDIIQSKLDGKGYVITGNYGDYATAIRQMHISNASEWLKLNK
jgi:hypothetical protein